MTDELPVDPESLNAWLTRREQKDWLANLDTDEIESEFKACIQIIKELGVQEARLTSRKFNYAMSATGVVIGFGSMIFPPAAVILGPVGVAIGLAGLTSIALDSIHHDDLHLLLSRVVTYKNALSSLSFQRLRRRARSRLHQLRRERHRRR